MYQVNTYPWLVDRPWIHFCMKTPIIPKFVNITPGYGQELNEDHVGAVRITKINVPVLKVSFVMEK